ncbi:IPExxxVDY family protein [Solitalea sp. MAHUQ-68]|uniref:IPExxxVDY family protein n=1 Tax=Solitalea agri TaxID=2953739 RepID=A0A9X2FAK8_9SPHI|nr:IPExxxVDY family protein [Solitalea agri]MCO4293413.1 IPExxxVDY family protein [Solitalea agri]
MNKKVLKVSFDFDFTLIGISAPTRDYRLCWFLNKELSLNLVKTEDIILTNKTNEEIYFSKYHQYFEESEQDYFLLTNKGTEGFLVPEHKEIDFFLLIHNLNYQTERDTLLSKINKISITQTAFFIDANKLKSKENLLL